jgi:hypothetical protein
MTADFFDRFAASPGAETPLGLQLLYPEPPDLDADAVTAALRDYHPDMAAATVELFAVADHPAAAKLVSADGPPASALGLLGWGNHVVKLAAFNAPMPYGPVETCVVPAMMPPELKEEARQHKAHVLLYYAGSDPDPVERYVALAAAAGALARFGASVILNEEARAAVPAYDLIPDAEEDALRTLRGLPVPYLWGGFVRMDAGDANRLWVRTFANHRLGLPNLAYQTTGPGEVRRAFELFAGMLGYLKQMGETFTPGDTIDLGDGTKLRLREPADAEWYLDSDGLMLVVEPLLD